MALTAFYSISATKTELAVVQRANHELEAVTALIVNANRYSEQIAEYPLIGESERIDYESARVELQDGFKRLEAVTLDAARANGRNLQLELAPERPGHAPPLS